MANKFDSDGGTVLEQKKQEVKPPPMYKVLLLNDDYTPMEFVVGTIQQFFNKTREQATQILSGVLYQTGSKRDARLKDAPLLSELMDKYKTTESVRRLAKVVLAADEFGRPIVFPPGVPADRVKIIRDAFNKTISDPAFLAEAEKRRLDIDPANGEELDSLAKEVMTATPEIVERVKKLIGM